MAETPGWSAPDPGSDAGRSDQASVPGSPPPGPTAWGRSPWEPPPAPPKPGVVPLRPLGVGEVLDGAVTYIRRYPRPTLGLATGVAVVLLVLQAVSFAVLLPTISFEEALTTAEGTDTGSTDVALNLMSLVQGLVQQIIVLIATGMLTFVMGQAVLGRATTTREAWQRVRPRIGALVGLGLLSLVAILAAMLLPFVPALVVGLAAGGVPAAVLAVVAVPVAIALTVYVYLNLVLAPSALVLERIGVIASIRRSRALLRDGFWRTFGVLALAFVISGLVGSLFGFFFAMAAGLVGGLTVGAEAALIGGLGGFTFGSVVGTVVTIPFDAGIRSLLYIDRRIRREGFDLTLVQAASTGPNTTAAPPPGRVPGAPPPAGQRW